MWNFGNAIHWDNLHSKWWVSDTFPRTCYKQIAKMGNVLGPVSNDMDCLKPIEEITKLLLDNPLFHALFLKLWKYVFNHPRSKWLATQHDFIKLTTILGHQC